MSDGQRDNAGDQARFALEEQRARLAGATARLRERLDHSFPSQGQPDRPEQAGTPSADARTSVGEQPEANRHRDEHQIPTGRPLSSGQAVQMIVERAHRIAREGAGSQPVADEPFALTPTVTPVASPPSPSPSRSESAAPAPAVSPMSGGPSSAPPSDSPQPSSSGAREPALSAPEALAPAPAESPRAAPAAAQALSLRSAPPWLGRALREMATRDPQAAGRLLLALLPAHGLVEPTRNLRYDLVVEDIGCLAVTLLGGTVKIAEQLAPRATSEVDFQVNTSLAGLGVLLAAGRTKRMIARERALVIPDRDRIDTLRALAQAPLGLRALHSVGVRLDPLLAYRALTLSVEPQWTAGHRFTLLHEVQGSPAQRCCVYVDGERPVSVMRPSRHTHATVTVLCPPDLFLPLLAGELTRTEERKLVHGDVEAFTALQDWIARIEWAGAYGG